MLELLALSTVLWPLYILAFVMAIIWLFVPFAIIGTKQILREIMRHEAETARILAAQRGTPETHVLCPYCREPVRNDASKCKHCLSPLTPRPPPPPDEEPKRGLRGLLTGRREPK